MTITTSIPTLILVVPFVAVACGGSPAAPANGGTGQTKLVVDIVGAGTVTYNPATNAPCTSPGIEKMVCPAITFQTGSVTATPAPGYIFFGWSLTFGTASPNTLTNPLSATQNIVPGTSAALTVTFQRAGPIFTQFTQQTFSTDYFVLVHNPDLDPIKIVWSGPNCGQFGPQSEQDGIRGPSGYTGFAMTWTHPHPPCAATTDHKDATIKATITFKDRVFVCEYHGAETGEGPACKLL